jgi:hypothetical protein
MVPSLLDQLSYAGGASEQNKMRAALAIAACAIDTVGSDLAGAESYSNFDKYMSTQFDIEHITPQSTAQRMSWASPDELKFIDSLGNLTLLHRTPNRSNGDSEPKAKASSYAVSEILMTKILCDFSLIGDLSHELSEELSNKHVADPKRLDFWGEASARQRHYYLTEKITGLLKGELSG